MSSPRDTHWQELESLLSEDVSHAKQRAETTLEKTIGPYGSSIVLFGAGNLGRRALGALRAAGTSPLAFADNNPALWEKSIDDVPVMSPAVAAAKYGDTAVFLVTIWSPGGGLSKAQRQLAVLGCRRIAPFHAIRWRHPERFGAIYCVDLPHKVIEHKDLVTEALQLWADEASRREYVAQVRFRLSPDFHAVAPPTDLEQYLPDDLFTVNADDVFVDCGAFDGDTLRSLVKRGRDSTPEVVAFEPDPLNFQKLTAYIATLPTGVRARVHARAAAVGSVAGTVRFAHSGTGSSAISQEGTYEVECVALDDVFVGKRATYIKMDIEGAEADALAGARRIIQTHSPILAISVYHKQDDLWRLPLLIRSLSDVYRLYLRPYDELFDLVCYAVPSARLRQTSVATQHGSNATAGPISDNA